MERVRKYNNNPLVPSLNIQDYHVLFPIPREQIDLNVGVIKKNYGKKVLVVVLRACFSLHGMQGGFQKE